MPVSGLCIEGGQHEGHFFRNAYDSLRYSRMTRQTLETMSREYGIDRIRLFFLYIGAHLVEICSAPAVLPAYTQAVSVSILWFDLPMNGIV